MACARIRSAGMAAALSPETGSASAGVASFPSSGGISSAASSSIPSSRACPFSSSPPFPKGSLGRIRAPRMQSTRKAAAMLHMARMRAFFLKEACFASSISLSSRSERTSKRSSPFTVHIPFLSDIPGALSGCVRGTPIHCFRSCPSAGRSRPQSRHTSSGG